MKSMASGTKPILCMLLISATFQVISATVPVTCTSRADIVFVVDSSSAVSESDFNTTVDFLKNVINDIDIDSGHIRVGLMRYSRETEINFHLQSHTSKKSLLHSLQHIRYSQGRKRSNLTHALEVARTQMFVESHGDRADSQNIAVIVGRDNIKSRKHLRAESERARDAGIVLLAIVAGRHLKTKLDDVISAPAKRNLYQVPQYSELDEIRTRFVKRVCKDTVSDERTLDFLDIGGSGSEADNFCTAKADIVVVLDSSTSVTEDNFVVVKSFLVDLFQDVDVDSGSVRVALVTYSTDVYVQFHLDRYKTRRELLSAIKAVPYNYGSTNTAGGIRTMRTDMFTTARGDRPGIPNIGIVITDGISNIDHSNTIPEAEKARDAGIHIFAIGIGLIGNTDELDGIATPPIEENRFTVDDFSGLDGIKEKVFVEVCEEGTPGGPAPDDSDLACTAKQDIVFVVDSSTSVTEDNFVLVKDFLVELLDGIDINSGRVRVGVVTYSTDVYVQFQLNTHRTKNSLLDAVRNIRYHYGSTNTAGGLEKMHREMFTPANGDRPGVPNICIILTDGISNIDPMRTIPNAEEARAAGIHIFAVGIGLVGNTFELEGMASPPIDDNIFSVDDFDKLNEIRHKLFEGVCEKDRVSAVPPSAVVTPTVTRVVEGETAVITCVARGSPTPVIRWTRSKPGLDLPDDHIVNNGVLTIPAARRADQDMYVCQAVNELGVAEARGRLVVTSPLRVEVTPPQLSVSPGTPVTLRCRAVSGEPPITLRWERADGRTLSSLATDTNGVLSISEATLLDGGPYRCVGTNAGERAEATSSLNVMQPPQVTVTPARQTVNPGGRLLIRCRARGTQPIGLEWTKVGGRIRDDAIEGDGVLEIRGARPSDAGQYRCRAYNDAGEDTADAVVKMLDPPKVKVTPTTVTTKSGRKVLLKCRAVQGSYPMTLRWTRERGEIPKNAIEGDGILMIPSVSRRDAGRYKCTGTNEAGSDEQYGTIRVLDPPKVKVKPKTKIVKPGDKAIFSCRAISGSYPMTLKWTRVGGELPKNAIEGDGVLNIRSTAKEDAGTYKCTATNEAGKDEETATLRILEPPQVAVEPPTQQVKPGERILIRCRATAGTLPIVLEWTKSGGGRIPDDAIEGDGVLQIPSASSGDVGRYKCTGTNEAGSDEAYASVQMLEPPVVTVKPEVKTIRSGEKAILSCRARGTYPMSLKWKRVDGKPLPRSAREGDGILEVRYAVAQDAGLYRCTATNEAGIDSADAELKVIGPPTAKVIPGDVTRREGESVTFRCQTTGSPPPDITWSSEAGRLPRNHRTRGDTLTLVNLKIEDAGHYTCVATNEAGSATDVGVLGVAPVVPGECSGKADIVFVLDSSGSVIERNFMKVIDFVAAVVNATDIDSGNFRVGLLTYSDDVLTGFSLDDYKTKDKIIEALKTIRYTYGSTNTAGALRSMQQMFVETAGDRPDVPNVAIVVTDGLSNVNQQQTIPEARRAKANGITMFAIGIGFSTIREELEGIASEPTRTHMFRVVDYSALEGVNTEVIGPICTDSNDCQDNPCENGGSCVDTLTGYICRCEAKFAGANCDISCGEPKDIIFGIDSSGSIGMHNFEALKAYVMSLVADLDMATCGFRIGILTFSTAGRSRIHLNEFSETHDLLSAIDSISYMHGFTHTADALRIMRESMFTVANGDRPSAPNVIVLLSDGLTNIRVEHTLHEARRAKNDGIHIIPVGVAVSDKSDMEAISSNGAHFVDTFVDLVNTRENVLGELFEDQDQCASNPCQNEAECVDGINKYMCKCKPGFSGHNCDGSCNSVADVVFVVDSSSWVGKANFMKLKQFLLSIVERFEFSSGKFRVGLVSYGIRGRVRMLLNEGTERMRVMNAILALSYEGGEPFAADAFEMMTEEMFTRDNGDREDVQNFGILVTTGLMYSEYTLPEAKKARAHGIHMFGVGIGLTSSDARELNEIVSRPSEQNAFINGDFSHMKNVSDKILSALCQDGNYCESKPCQNGATCIENLQSYTCQCPDGFSGMNCERGCDAKADVVLLLDSSGSIGNSEWEKVIQFADSLIQELQISSSQTRVGVATFASNARIQFYMNKYHSKNEVRKALNLIPFEYGDTFTAAGLQLIRQKMFTERHGDRPNVQNFGIVVTDGVSNVNSYRTVAEAERARKDGIHLFTVGIGLSNERELVAMASKPSDMNSFLVDDHAALSSVPKDLVKYMCQDESLCAGNPCKNDGRCEPHVNTFFCRCPDGVSGETCERTCNEEADIVFVVDSSSSVGEYNFKKIKRFLTTIVENMEMASGKTRFALIRASDYADIQFSLGRYTSRLMVTESIKNMGYVPGGTNMAEALTIINEEIFDEGYGHRPTAPKFIVIIADGESNVDSDKTIPEAQRAHAAGTYIFTVSVGMDDTTELKQIASEEKAMIVADSFAGLTNVTDTMLDALCQYRQLEPKVLPSPKPTKPDDDDEAPSGLIGGRGN